MQDEKKAAAPSVSNELLDARALLERGARDEAERLYSLLNNLSIKLRGQPLDYIRCEFLMMLDIAGANEREACAKIADGWDDGFSNSNYASRIAEEIRSRNPEGV